MRNCFFYIYIYWCSCWCFELCLETLSTFKEPRKWRFPTQLQSLSPVLLFFWQLCCVQTAFMWLRGRTHCPVCLSSGVSHFSLKKQVLWLHVGAFNCIPQAVHQHEDAEHAVICVAAAANMMLIQQNLGSFICSAVGALWDQPRGGKYVFCFICFKASSEGKPEQSWSSTEL